MPKKTTTTPENSGQSEIAAVEAPESAAAETPESVCYTVADKRGLNLRREPNRFAVVVAVLPYLSKVTAVDAPCDGWLPVKTENGKTGYVMMKYLSVEADTVKEEL